MRWLPKPKHRTWWLIGLVVAAGQFAAMGVGAALLSPHSNPKYPEIALFCLVTGLIIGGAGWLGARWFPPIATLGLILGLAMMLNSFLQIDGWGDLVGLLSFMFMLLGGLALGLAVELIIWAYRRYKTNKSLS